MILRFGISLLMVVTAAALIRAQGIDTAEQKEYYKLTKTVSEVYLKGDNVRAAALAKKLLEVSPEFHLNWNYGNAIHTAHIVLGRIAADADDLAEARKQLLESATTLFDDGRSWGKVKASPQLDSFGPDMTLAKVLLEKGERDAVLKYLDACGEFWTHKDTLDEWRSEVKAGKMPDFGPNMRYYLWKK